MKSLQIITVFIFLMTIWVELGYGIKCFDCNSLYNDTCGKKITNGTEFLVDCAKEHHGCRKVVQKVKVSDDWEIRYIRQCAEHGEVSEKCKYKVGTDDIKMYYCYCKDKDGCNSGSSLYSTIFLIFFAVIGQFLGYEH